MVHQSVNGGSSTALGELIARERQRRSLTRRELAEAMRKIDRTLGTNDKAIQRWELRGRIPLPAAMRALAAALGRPVEELTALVGQSTVPAQENGPSLLELPPAAPADHEYVEAIRGTVQRLVGLEVQYGGDDVAPLAVRSFHSARRRLAVGGHPAGLTRDLTAAAGELAEVAAWLLHDSDQQEAAQQLNVEALYLSRLAGDRSTELLTMSNMTFVSLFVQQPGEALMLARAALQGGKLTNRQRVIFELREARALAQLGARSEALQIAQRAQSSFSDDTTRRGEWVWWADASEVAGHVAWTHLEAGDPATAAAMLQRATEAELVRWGEAAWAGGRFFRLARLFVAMVGAGAWGDAETVIEQVLPYLGEVRSGRSARLLRDGIRRIEKGSTTAPPRMHEAGHHLRDLLTAAGYGP